MIDARDGLRLPEGTRLLHIGPHKTGTTSIQGAFHVRRREAAAQGVHYAGPNRQPMQAAHAITGKPSPYADGKTPSLARWRELVREVDRAREPRVVISSEGFADADEAGAVKVVSDLGRGRVHVVVTLRPLAVILPSQWQQYVQNGLVLAYEAWLDKVLNEPGGSTTPTFWHRHRHDQLVARWAAAAGAEHVTVVVADEADRDHVVRVFEGLVGLRAGSLAPQADLTNRSLTHAEVETVRAFNIAFRGEGLGTLLHTKLMRFGAGEHLKRREPRPDEPRIRTPGWALERAAEISREIVAGIAASGVRVVGDLATLAPTPPTDAPGADPTLATPDEVWAEISARAGLGIVLASGLARGRAATAGSAIDWPDGPLPAGPLPPPAHVEPLELARLSTPLLGFVLLRRLIGSVTSRLPLPRRGS